MKNIINYYYNLNLLDVYEESNKFIFNINNHNYYFIIYNRLISEAQDIYNMYLELKNRNILVNDIITNKDNKIITMVNKIPYILIKDNTYNKSININDILYLENNTINIYNKKKLYRNDWVKMWENKIDFYEEEIKNISKKNKIILDTIDFYIGMGENAIEYLVNNNIKDVKLSMQHKRVDINKGSFDFYNPINFIVDSRVRDLVEYTKILFFNDKINLDIFINYLNYMNFSKDEYILLISRLLFPTFYFDQLDNIINDDIDENIIKNIISKTPNYIIFVKNIMIYIIYNKRINLSIIEWIIKYS